MKPKVFLEKDVKYQKTGPKETDKDKWKEVTRAHKKSTSEGNRHSCYVPLYYVELEICEKKDRHNRTIKEAEKRLICPRKTTQAKWFMKYLKQGMPGVKDYDWITNPQNLYGNLENLVPEEFVQDMLEQKEKIIEKEAKKIDMNSLKHRT